MIYNFYIFDCKVRARGCVCVCEQPSTGCAFACLRPRGTQQGGGLLAAASLRLTSRPAINGPMAFTPNQPRYPHPQLPPSQGACLFYREWSRPLNTLAEDPQEERKLMFGMLYSIKGLVAALGSKVRAWGVCGGQGAGGRGGGGFVIDRDCGDATRNLDHPTHYTNERTTVRGDFGGAEPPADERLHAAPLRGKSFLLMMGAGSLRHAGVVHT